MDFVSQRMCAHGTAFTLVFPFKARFISGFSTAFYVNIEIADFTGPQACNELHYLCTNTISLRNISCTSYTQNAKSLRTDVVNAQ